MTVRDGSVEIRGLARPARLTDPDAQPFVAAADLAVRVRRDLWGDDDHAESLPEQFALAANTPTEHWRAWLALDARARVVGLVTATLPQRENHDVAWIDVVVDPGRRRAGIGSALLDAAERELRAAGRTVLAGWSETPGTAPGRDTVPARSGEGGLPGGVPVAAFARRHGFVLEQVERLGRLDLPVPAATLDAVSPAPSRTAGYELVGWVDAAPTAAAADYARLKTAMSTDIPSADLAQDAEVWDADRMAQEEAELAARGGHRLVSAVRDLRTGRLVGHTVLERFDARPAVAYQEDTLVLAEHRGRRLGILLKTDNLRRLATVWPDVRRVYTWNAEENTPVLDINAELGFRQVGVVGAWQKRLT
ncbi:hypothetical protein GCM10011512_11550 [Tersicoccus solisilvae]|uniref:N-acetyltransferase domain-containing protein n=1 Tax=Tersicoccus solisilvae TaxID=1882339 RepID=A0ABQ1NW31_9MICC|nr:GNAT family N-acetyltransferase [Tersicoccus solisilvae]GGC86324.1 hypothetical protein GCM10011512_11550 [Tersicoccus solisilvae]